MLSNLKLHRGIRHLQIILKRTKMKVGVIGVPFSRGQIKSGTEKAPNALRKAGVIEELKQMGHDVKDYGDVCYNEKETIGPKGEVHENMSWLPQVAVCSEKVSLKAEEVIMKDRILLTLGGDHSVALGSVDGHIKARLGNVSVLWVDAHPDLNTADTSPSGNLHGMTAALLVKEMSHFWPYLPGLDWQKPTISINKLAYIGLRSIDSDERVIIEKFGVTAYGMSDIEKLGIHDVTEEAIWKINPDGDSSIHLSFDIDALDSLEAPSTGTSVRGGLTLREALILVETVQKTGRLKAIDLVEINPLIGTDHQVKLTLEAAIHIVKAAFAHSRSGKIRHRVYPTKSSRPSDGTDISHIDLKHFFHIEKVKKKKQVPKADHKKSVKLLNATSFNTVNWKTPENKLKKVKKVQKEAQKKPMETLTDKNIKSKPFRSTALKPTAIEVGKLTFSGLGKSKKDFGLKNAVEVKPQAPEGKNAEDKTPSKHSTLNNRSNNDNFLSTKGQILKTTAPMKPTLQKQSWLGEELQSGQHLTAKDPAWNLTVNKQSKLNEGLQSVQHISTEDQALKLTVNKQSTLSENLKSEHLTSKEQDIKPVNKQNTLNEGLQPVQQITTEDQAIKSTVNKQSTLDEDLKSEHFITKYQDIKHVNKQNTLNEELASAQHTTTEDQALKPTVNKQSTLNKDFSSEHLTTKVQDMKSVNKQNTLNDELASAQHITTEDRALKLTVNQQSALNEGLKSEPLKTKDQDKKPSGFVTDEDKPMPNSLSKSRKNSDQVSSLIIESTITELSSKKNYDNKKSTDKDKDK